MPDFPSPMLEHMGGACISTNVFPFSTAIQAELAVVNFAAAAWPSNNLAIYVPFVLDQPKTAKQMFWENGAANGNTDVGIYDALGNRLVNLGSTANAGTIQVGNIADTFLTPGLYYAAMAVSTTVTETVWSAVVPATHLRACGCQQQATALPLPTTATFAVVSNAYLPMIGISFQATM